MKMISHVKHTEDWGYIYALCIGIYRTCVFVWCVGGLGQRTEITKNCNLIGIPRWLLRVALEINFRNWRMEIHTHFSYPFCKRFSFRAHQSLLHAIHWCVCLQRNSIPFLPRVFFIRELLRNSFNFSNFLPNSTANANGPMLWSQNVSASLLIWYHHQIQFVLRSEECEWRLLKSNKSRFFSHVAYTMQFGSGVALACIANR